jgi:predicted outer membrane repeat protein
MSRQRRNLIPLVAAGGLVLAGAAASAQTIVYVDDDAPPGGDGLSWNTPYRFLQDALTDAGHSGGAITEIRVAQGTYLPDERDYPPSDCCESHPNPGCDDSFCESLVCTTLPLCCDVSWDPECAAAAEQTCGLCGDPTGNRGMTFQLVNGVALMGGYAGIGAPNPDVRDIAAYETILSGNIGDPGSSGDNSYHIVTCISVDDNTVIDGFTITAGHANVTAHRNGAGMYNENANPTVANCIFSNNRAYQGFPYYIGSGGGMYNDASSPALTNCTFSDNYSTYGGGIKNSSGSSPIVTNCTFSGNIGGWGAGIHTSTDPGVTLIDCTFTDNSAWYGGGGTYGGVAAATNCTFSGNASGGCYYDYCYGGGAMGGVGGLQQTGTVTITDCTFVGNQSDQKGGAIYSGAYLVLSNCSFSGNSADAGGAIAHYSYDPVSGEGLVMANCSFDGNSAAFGGAMYHLAESRATVTDCMFIENTAEVGGGMYNTENSIPTVNISTFMGNTATGLGGGGMANVAGGNPTVTDCVFKANRAIIGDGGGMYNDASNPTVTGCTFVMNTTELTHVPGPSEHQGGGMYNTQGATPYVLDCLFVSNQARFSGAIGGSWSNPTIIRCVFLNNLGSLVGGAVGVEFGGASIINCTFGGNASGQGGAVGFYNGEDSCTIRNSVFAGNVSVDINSSGAVHVWNAAASIANCTFWANNAAAYGAGGVYSGQSQTTVSGSVFWQNTPVQVLEAGAGLLTLSYCDIDGGWTGEGEGNIDADPLFVDPHGLDGIPGTADDDFRLSVGSPCVDAGDTGALCCDEFDLDNDGDLTELVPVDRDGNPRRLEVLEIEDTGSGLPPVVDIGAYEFDAGTTLPETPYRIWVGASPQDPSGVFDMPGNWQETLIPGASDIAIFDIDELYTVSFQSSPVTDELSVRRGDVLFDLNGYTYTVTSGDLEAFVVGELPGVPIQLTISNGSIAANTAVIGYQDSTGTVRVAGPGASLDLAVLGVVNSGQLIVEPGGTVNAPATLSVLQNGSVSGDGLISAFLMSNFGTVSPGENGPGTLQVNGTYRQIGDTPSPGASGTLMIELSSTGHDALNVDGDAYLLRRGVHAGTVRWPVHARAVRHGRGRGNGDGHHYRGEPREPLRLRQPLLRAHCRCSFGRGGGGLRRPQWRGSGHHHPGSRPGEHRHGAGAAERRYRSPGPLAGLCRLHADHGGPGPQRDHGWALRCRRRLGPGRQQRRRR